MLVLRCRDACNLSPTVRIAYNNSFVNDSPASCSLLEELTISMHNISPRGCNIYPDRSHIWYGWYYIWYASVWRHHVKEMFALFRLVALEGWQTDTTLWQLIYCHCQYMYQYTNSLDVRLCIPMHFVAGKCTVCTTNMEQYIFFFFPLNVHSLGI